jgi:hypothetical protein
MAASSWSNVSDSQKRVYQATEKYIKAVENNELTLLNLCDEFKEVKAIGESGGVRFPIFISPAKNISGGNNGGVTQNDVRQRIEKPAACAAVEVSSNFEITDMLTHTGTAEGAFEDELTRHITETTDSLAKMLQRYFCVSGGSSATSGMGRLCVIQLATIAVTTFTANVDPNVGAVYGTAGLMVNDVVDIYNDGTGVASQYTNVLITAIDPATGIVTTDTTMTLTAGWGVYRYNMYNIAINGLQNLIDDGTSALTIHGLTRSTYPQALNSVCKSVYNGGVAVELTQDMIDQRLNLVLNNGGKIEIFYGDPGVNNSFNRINATLRQWNVQNGAGPFKQVLGQKGLGSYEYRGQNVEFQVDVNALPRVMYGFSKGLLRKYVARPMSFMNKDGAMLSRGFGSSGAPKTTWTGVNLWQGNIGIQKPNHAMAIFGVKDTFTGRDTL